MALSCPFSNKKKATIHFLKFQAHAAISRLISSPWLPLSQFLDKRLLVAHNMSGFVARDLSGFIHSFILRVCDEAGRVATGTKTHAI